MSWMYVASFDVKDLLIKYLQLDLRPASENQLIFTGVQIKGTLKFPTDNMSMTPPSNCKDKFVLNFNSLFHLLGLEACVTTFVDQYYNWLETVRRSPLNLVNNTVVALI